MNHEEVFRQIVKKDQVFLDEMEAAGQKPSMLASTLEKGVWCASYFGWHVAKYGAVITKGVAEKWRLL